MKLVSLPADSAPKKFQMHYHEANFWNCLQLCHGSLGDLK